MAKKLQLTLSVLFLFITRSSFAQNQLAVRDSVVKRIVYRDTIIYRQVFHHDTVRVRHFVFSDTVRETPPSKVLASTNTRRKRLINPNNWGIGPSIGTYYSPYNGFDINFGFGVQYYLLAVPSFRNPHLGHRRKK